MVEVGGARRGQVDAPSRAGEQGDAELGLELADLLRQRRLRHVEAFGGPAEVPLLGDGDEVAEVAQFHPLILAGFQSCVRTCSAYQDREPVLALADGTPKLR